MLDEKQLALRRTGISGTDIARICGLSEFGSPLDVYLEKKGLAEPLEVTPAMERGIYLEPAILEWYKVRSGAVSVEQCGTIQLAGQPLIMATPDARALFDRGRPVPIHEELYERRAVEVKAPGRFAESGWGEPGTDQVPPAYLCQAAFEMAVLDVERLDFAALLGGELKIYPVKRNRKVESQLIERALAFWRDHVEADKPPAPTWRERDQEWIQRTFPRATKPALQWDALDPFQRIQVEEFLVAHMEAAEASKRKVEMELRLKLFIGDAGGIDGIKDLPEDIAEYVRIDWRENASGTPSWKKIAEALKSGTSWEDALKANTGTPSRPFVPRKSKKGDE